MGELKKLVEEDKNSHPQGLTFANLQDQIPPFSTKVAICYIETRLGAPILQLFIDINPEHIATASLGQVYKAHLHTGELVAVKVQRPSTSLFLTLDALLFNLIGGQLKRFAKTREDFVVVNETILMNRAGICLNKLITSLKDKIVSGLLLCMVSMTVLKGKTITKTKGLSGSGKLKSIGVI
ncbi:protein kinase superfamily protein [Artemisia annua]|uniref:Protein kinase superfamily protein n=1 Tax=Artemisia annua TaxID=35608 RepID=A0A2U1PAY9_ARTAN|nr:protein kinase superfamily protein [Artemisia annua]